MRELLAARSGRDGIVASAPLRGRGRPAPSVPARLVAFLTARPTAVAGVLVVSAAGAAIAVNALAWQTARHPAPLFQDRPRPAVESPAQRRPETVRVEPLRAEPARSEPARVEPAPALAAPIPPARPAAAPAQPAARSGRPDQIGDMLRGNEATGAVARANTAPAEPLPRVAAAQRALSKLGYGPLTADGRYGPSTRSAVERFERDRRLSPTGDLNPRTLRELVAASGIAIE